MVASRAGVPPKTRRNPPLVTSPSRRAAGSPQPHGPCLPVYQTLFSLCSLPSPLSVSHQPCFSPTLFSSCSLPYLGGYSGELSIALVLCPVLSMFHLSQDALMTNEMQIYPKHP